MFKYLPLILLLFSGWASAQKISALPAATAPLAGTELVPCVQGGVTDKCTAANVAQSVALSGDVATTTGSSVATIQAGAVTLAKQANLAASTIQGNATLSAAAPQALNPMSVANLMNATVGALSAVQLGASVHAFGTFTNDGVVLGAGNIVMVTVQGAGQTCGTGTNSGGTGGAVSGSGFCQGLWVVQAAAAWTRPVNFPSGYVIPANCNLIVTIAEGTAFQGHNFYRANISGTTTIDSSNPNFLDKTIAPASATSFGLVEVTGSQSTVPSVSGTFVFNDCISAADTAGTIADQGNSIGNTGPCVTSDANGHPLLPANGSPPVVTGTGCSLTAGTASDNHGAITATGIDSCTLTFSSAFSTAPLCTVSGVGATVIPRLHALPTTALATFDTAAAGTFSYACL